MPQTITAAMLYDSVYCPHRVKMDLFGDSAIRDPISPFVQLLWERGQAFENQIVEGLQTPFLNLRPYPIAEKERLTREAITRGEALIYGGRISADDLIGEPDLLRRQGEGYVAGDIKSGAGVEGATEENHGKPKKHYAVQLALYTDILERLRVSSGRRPFIWDVHGDEVIYDLDAPEGVRTPKTPWEIYQTCLAEVRSIASKDQNTLPALASICKLCPWRSACTKQLISLDDLTLIPDLGRAKRDAMISQLPGVHALANADLGLLIKGKKTVFAGVGPDTLLRFQVRARLQIDSSARPLLKERLNLPPASLELFFDIETDPMRDICYLHGFLERRGGDERTERYVSFFAEHPTPESEEQAFAAAWEYVRDSRPCVVYYYSHYERTVWRKLQRLHPLVATEPDIAEMFASINAVDLYTDVIKSQTEWPTRDYSIKTLATFLGFAWRDPEPSGAASIEWYHRWTSTGDPAIRQRILEYNEDDCRATRVLLDALRDLSLQS